MSRAGSSASRPDEDGMLGPVPASRLDRLAPDPVPVPADSGLRRRYAAYRRREGAGLLSLLPPEGVRSVYGAALADGVVRPSVAEGAGDDVFGALAEYCADRLPLPPFDIWREDFESNRGAHLAEGDRGTSGAPVTVDLRSFEDAEGRSWYAALDLWRDVDGGVFRGSIAFHESGGSRHYGTGVVFREAAREDVRSRFATFDDTTLRAFLRSVLP